MARLQLTPVPPTTRGTSSSISCAGLELAFMYVSKDFQVETSEVRKDL